MNHWIDHNQKNKQAHRELLTLTASRGGTVRATWLGVGGQQFVVDQAVIDGTFPSLTLTLPELAWDEREIHDLFGYVPEGHPDLRPLIRTPRWPSDWFPLQDPSHSVSWRDVEPDIPSRRVEGDGITIMKVGPTHAGIIESGHFVFSLMGENVLHLDAHLFQNHRGIEALLEGKPLEQVGPVISRTCAADSVSHQTNWALAVEGLAGFQAPPALIQRRVMLLENERVLSHLNDLAQIPAGVGFQVAHQRALALKEYWQRCMGALYGHRLLFDTVAPGRAEWAPYDEIRGALRGFRDRWEPWRRLVDGHQAFHDRLLGVGRTTLAQVTRFGAQGISARAAGKPFDARQALPWYEDRFAIPVTESAGDVAARFAVRIGEVEASVQIIEAAAAACGRTPPADPPFTAAPDLGGRIVTFTESPHGLNAHDVTVTNGRVLRYHIRAGTYRNWPLLAQAMAGNMLADFPLINKSFELCYSCTDR